MPCSAAAQSDSDARGYEGREGCHFAHWGVLSSAGLRGFAFVWKLDVLNVG